MSSDDKKRKSRWNKFDKLFDFSKPEREKSFSQKNLVFLKEFVSIEMNKYSLPEIDNAHDFSEIIEALRISYRQWNQRLMGLMIIDHQSPDSASKRDLDEFTKTCP